MTSPCSHAYWLVCLLAHLLLLLGEQVGKDASACKFLERLDKDPVVGSSIDCTSYFELEQVRRGGEGEEEGRPCISAGCFGG